MKDEPKVELSPLTVRVLEFVESKKGPSKVAAMIGGKPSVFYNFESGRSEPSSKTLKALAEAYPDFDVKYMLTGVPSATVNPTVEHVELEKALIRVELLERENARLSRDNERMMQAFLNNLLVDVEGKKLVASSGAATAEELLYSIGVSALDESADKYLSGIWHLPAAALLAKYRRI